MGADFTARGGGTRAVCLVLVVFAGSLAGARGLLGPFVGITTSAKTGGVVLVLLAAGRGSDSDGIGVSSSRLMGVGGFGTA